ncbi:MAG: type I signal peptidase SipW [Parcubacteria group bacterium Gr01-1014_56]|nr:MAG: type I signal peptidase SipW [Parcubacteria group bacterium Gr01-1014_56]
MNVITKIIYGFFIAALLGVTGLFLASLAPIPGNIEVKIVKSGSMAPAIPVGSLVVVKPQASYAVGEVVTFGEDSARQIPTTHRIVSIEGSGTNVSYRVKGDANEEADPELVNPNQIIGKVFVAVPYAGYVLDFAKQPLGFALLIGVPAALIILEELLAIARETRILIKKRRRARAGGREDDEDAPPSPEVPIKPTFIRQRITDDIFVPMRLVVAAPMQKVSDEIRLVGGRDRRVAFSLLLICMVGTYTLSNAAGATLSYFSDLETSVGNIFQAGEWGPSTPSATFVNGNPTCPSKGYALEAKIDPIVPGVTVLNVPDVGSITLTVDAVERFFDWVSDFGIDAVIAKGGPNANLYIYDPPAESFGDTGLHAPLGAGPGGTLPFGISHVSFCYDIEEEIQPLLLNSAFSPEEEGEVAGAATEEEPTVELTESVVETIPPPAEETPPAETLTEPPAEPPQETTEPAPALEPAVEPTPVSEPAPEPTPEPTSEPAPEPTPAQEPVSEPAPAPEAPPAE